jgi:LPXTG-site transpeptidase (sortase) family protein
MSVKSTHKKPKKSSKPSAKRNVVRQRPKQNAAKSGNLVSIQTASKPRFYAAIGVFFIVAGVLLSYQPLLQYWQIHHQKPEAPALVRDAQIEAATKASQTISGKPARIVIASLNIDIPVADGVYNARTKAWTLSTNKAHYALMTPKPNNQWGNTFIYGHNRPEVFSRLSKLQTGQTAVVYTDNNHVFTYSYRSARETNPNDDSLFTYQGPPILTLQTCSGLWYQNRYLMTFDLIGVV